MPRVALPFAIRSYQGRTRVATIERLVNLYPERVEALGTNTTDAPSVVLIGAPGSRPFIELPEDDSTEINGLHSAGGFIWAVSRQGVYRIDAKENPVIKKIGSGSFGKHVTMADNLNTEIGDQVWFSDGTAGYVIDTSFLSVQKITDDGFFPASSTTFLNGYAVWSRKNTGQFFWSAINDASSYNTLDVSTAEADSDNILRIINFENDVWAFGEETIEPWQTAATGSSAFRRIGNAVIRPGTASGPSVAVLNNKMIWIGSDLSVYAVQGRTFSPTRISKHQGVEHDLYSDGADGSFAFVSSQEGHDKYWLQLPKSNKTWVYDFSTGSWFERASWNFDACKMEEFKRECWPISYGQHIGQSSVFHKGSNYIGVAGGLAILDLDYTGDLNQRILREAISAPISFAGQESTIINSIELEFQLDCNPHPDVKFCCESFDDAYDPESVSLDFTDDLGKTFRAPRFRSLQRERLTQFNNRSVWTRNGVSRRRAWRLRTLTGRKLVLNGVIFDYERDVA